MKCSAVLLVIGTGILGGCASSRAPREPLPADGYPGVLRAASTLGTDVLWQQTVTATWPAGEQGFDAALQVQGDELLVIGLSPIGQPGFLLRLVDEQITVENRSGMELPIPPRYVLLDVQRVFFPWLECAPTFTDGARVANVHGENVVERWRSGRLVERRFTRLDNEPPGEIRVDYEWGRDDWLAPTRAVLVNGWYGYSLEVRTHAETRLPKPSESAP